MSAQYAVSCCNRLPKASGALPTGWLPPAWILAMTLGDFIACATAWAR